MTITNEGLSNLNIKYHFLIDNILDVVGELDSNGIFTYVNPYIYDELGYQPDEIIGREIYEFVHPDDAKKITKVLLRRPKSHDFIPEIRLKNDQNQFIWYEIKARRIKDYNNQRKILITLKNISKVKVLEEKLEKKEENYQKITNSIPEIQFWKVLTHSKYERTIHTTSEMLKVIIENIPQCVFWKDTNLKYLGCNGNYSEFIGIEHPESIVGKTDEDLLSNREKIQQIKENETNVMLSGKPLYHSNESWIIEKGENIWLDINRVPLIDNKGDVNGILVAFEEITDRKIAEEKLRNSEKKYKNLSSELETIMDIIPSMIFVKNKSGIYTRVNQVFADYLKLEKEDVIGKSTFDLFSQEVATNLKRDDLEVIKNGIPKLNIEKTVEFPVGKVSGIISKMPYYNEKDEINGIIGFAIDISERKELEQRLIKSEERFRELANSLPQVISETDERGNLTFVNKNAYSVFGYTPDDFKKGLNALQMLIPEDRKRAMENSKRVLRGKKEEKIEDNEYIALRKDGSTFPVIIYSSPIIYKDTSVGLRSIIIDITDKMKVEQRLKESEAKFRNITEQSLMGIAILQNDRFKYVNKQYADISGYTPEEMKNWGRLEYAKLIHPDDKEIVLEQARKKQLGLPGAVIHYQFRSLTKSGEVKWIEIYSQTMKYLGENAVLITLIDITERKESEQEREKFFNIPLHILLIARFDGTILRTNPGWKEILGYDESDLIGNNFADLLHPDDQEASTHEMKKLSKGFVTKHFENRYRSKDGSYRTLAWSAVPNLDNKTVYAIAYDVTEQRHVESEIIASEKKLKDLIEAIPIGITISNPAGELSEVNSHALNMFGYDSKDEYLKIPAIKFYANPADRLQYTQLLKIGPVREFEVKFKRKDGKLFWGSLTSIAKTVGDDVIYFNTVQDISHRKSMEKIFTDLAKFPAENPNPVLRVSKEFILYANQAGNNLFQAIVGDKIPLVLENYVRTAFKEKKNLNSEIQLNSHIFSIFIAPIEGTEYANIYGMNITERTIAERKLKESEEDYRLITENANDIIAVLDDKFRLEYISEAPLNKMLGYKGGDYMGLSDLLVIHPDDRKMVLNGLMKGSEVGKGILDARLRHIDGHYIWVESRGKTFNDSKGEKKILINIRNIADRKKAEQQLRESEEKYRLLIETAVMGLVEFDNIGNKVSYINPKLLEILGYTKKELLDEKMFMKIVHPEDLENLMISREDKIVDFRIITKDGKLKWLSGTRNNIYDQEGKIISARFWLQDSTENKEVEEIKSNLLTRFSHEFKTPLISITGFADFLLMEHKKKLDKKTLLFLKRIKDGSDRLKNLINSFVESSQLDKAIVHLNLRQENLHTLINEALDEFEGLKQMRKHEIDLNIGKKLITSLDKEKIFTVIANLLINAFKYTQKGGKITIQSKIDKKSITISIKDTGIGFDESEMIRLFKPFGKIERYGKGWDIDVGGMGMGLFISKEIIELHEGKIWAESEGRNEGSTFYFSIPITKRRN